ncbi:transposase [Streptomyces sp. NBC_00057]
MIRGYGVARSKPWEVDDELRAVIEPLLPKVKRRTWHPGRKRHTDRLVFQGILFVLHTGIAWEHLPQELGFGSIARRGTEHGSGLGKQRWVVERAFAHLHWLRRLRTRWEIRDDIHEAFLTLGCALICWRRLRALASDPVS